MSHDSRRCCDPPDQERQVVTLMRMPCTLKAARRFVGQHHRHSLPPVGGLFAVAVAVDREIVGVGIAGRPVARALDDGETVELTRCCTVGTANAASMIYGALCRAARALGYRRAVTYSLGAEPGTSLRAAGFVEATQVAARDWHSRTRPRHAADLFGNPITPPGEKIRWERML